MLFLISFGVVVAEYLPDCLSSHFCAFSLRGLILLVSVQLNIVIVGALLMLRVVLIQLVLIEDCACTDYSGYLRSSISPFIRAILGAVISPRDQVSGVIVVL